MNGRFFKNRAISLERSTLFIIEVSFLFYWLEMAFRSKLAKNIERMKSIPAFENVPPPLRSWKMKNWEKSSSA